MEKGVEINPKSGQENEAKEQIFDALNNLTNQLCYEGNFQIIDKSVDEDGAAAMLAEKLINYGKKLGNKWIESNSSAIDILRNLETIFRFVDRAKTKGLNDNYKSIIRGNYHATSKFIDLLAQDREVEKKELKKEGFFRGTKNQQEIDMLRSDKPVYIEKIAETEEKRKTA